MKIVLAPILTNPQHKEEILDKIIEELKDVTLFGVDLALTVESSCNTRTVLCDLISKQVQYIRLDIAMNRTENLIIEVQIPSIERVNSIPDLKKYRAMLLLCIYFKLSSGEENSLFDTLSLNQMIQSLQKVERILLSKKIL